MQIWLQGSDFDVDKVTLMGSAFTDAGKYVKWSRYMIDDSIEALNITSKLKFPTGKDTVVIPKVVGASELQYAPGESVNSNLYSRRQNIYSQNKDLTKYEVLFNEHNKLSLKKEDGSYDLDKLELLVEMINTFNTQIEGDPNSQLLKNIITVVNNHNHTDFGKYKDEALSNLVQHVGTRISKSIINAVASQQGTDDVSEPLKRLADLSPFGTKDYQDRYGNAAAKIKQLITNQTGKSGIAITASVGIKSFFAITQYFNMKLAQAKTPQEVLKYMFDVEVDGQHYRTLANINIDEGILREWETSNNNELREMARSVRQNDQIDADTTISGIMTLAVDNAKELKLAKLNASNEILGLYLYGVSIGVPFEKLVSIFTSNVADVLNQNIRGNAFEGQDDVRLGSAINNLKRGPFIKKEIVEKETSKINKAKILFDDGMKYSSIADMILGEDGFIAQAATKYPQKGKNYLLNRRTFIINKLTDLKSKLANLYKDGNEFDRRLVNRTYTYIDQIYRMYSSGEIEKTNQILKDIETLYGGKTEYATLKNLILNQGVRVLENEQLSWLNDFSNVIRVKTGGNNTTEVNAFKDANGGSALIDILKYTSDPEYKRLAIEAYDSVKHTVNILEVIDTLPHFREYLKGYGASIIAKMNSVKYQAKSKLQDMLFTTYKLKNKVDKQKMLKRLDNFLTSVLYNQFLKSQNVPAVQIQEGTTIIDEYGNSKVLDAPIYLQLGTDLGNVNFKLWVENTVLPDLQKRFVKNSFINEMIPKRYKNTQFENLIRSITLPIDMIPKSDSDISRLKRYIYDFNNLTKSYRKSGLTVQEIFYLYNMITYQNRNNTKALTPITDTLYTQNNSIASKAQEFISMFDAESSLIHKNVDLNESDISNFFTKEELLQAVAPTTREVDFKKFEGPYLRMFNYKELQWELLKRKKTDEETEQETKYRSEEDLDDYGDNDGMNDFGENEERVGDEDAELNTEGFGEEQDENQQNKNDGVKITDLFDSVYKFNQLGVESRINNILGKLPTVYENYQEYLMTDSEGVQIDKDMYATVNTINEGNKTRYTVTINLENEGEVQTFNVEPRTMTKILYDREGDTVNRNKVTVIDRLDLDVKINEKIRELLNIDCK